METCQRYSVVHPRKIFIYLWNYYGCRIECSVLRSDSLIFNWRDSLRHITFYFICKLS
uniref:Uncharacterized protein n=1 Tax=Ascaris lumbricoides TaxID=6252 RepID=A0A0M3IF71_ASCLU